MRIVFPLLLVLALAGGVFAREKKSYRNPVIERSAPDPTVIRAEDGMFYLYSTEDVRNLPIYKSKNLVDWIFTGTAFTDKSRPKMVPDGNIWAPDIQYIGDRYVLYYSKSRWGGEWECGIGVATADTPDGPFTDHGKLFLSNEIGVQNSIDPVYFGENGRHYLFWGSFRGIYGIELADDALSVKEGAKPVKIAGTLTEGTNIFKHDGHYYLIGSAGSCCEGERSTYHVVLARSRNLFGPYFDRDGNPAMENNFSTLLERSEKVIGPGHNANFISDDAGQFWMLYHGFDASDHEAGRKVFLDRIIWDSEGWPVTLSGEPSESAPAPIIRKR